MVVLDWEKLGSDLQLWAAAGLAAIFVFVLVSVFGRARRRREGVVPVSAPTFVLGLLGGSLATWLFLQRAEVRHLDAIEQAFVARTEELNARALSPGSPLSCLSVSQDPSMVTSCEKALFASPENVAAAISYVSAQLALLMEIKALRGGQQDNAVTIRLRRSLEADPFGMVAHVLVSSGCSSDSCKLFDLFQDTRKIRGDLVAQIFEKHLAQYEQEVWAKVADEQHVAVLPARRKPLANITYPSAASIPAVSIMEPEPNTNNTSSATNLTRGGTASDPVWSPSPPSGSAPQNGLAANGKPGWATPMQLNPFPSP